MKNRWNPAEPIAAQQVNGALSDNKDKSESPCIATGWLVCPNSFSTKNDPQMGSTEGSEKQGLHLKDKFSRVMSDMRDASEKA